MDRSLRPHSHSKPGDGGESLAPDSVTLNETTNDPTTNGEFTRNGADAKVYSGGAVRNLSKIGSSLPVENVVKDHGAVGDGVADDYGAIQAAADAAAGGGIVYFPPGTYLISQKVTVGEKTEFIAPGFNSALLGLHSTFTGNYMIQADFGDRFAGMTIDPAGNFVGTGQQGVSPFETDWSVTNPNLCHYDSLYLIADNAENWILNGTDETADGDMWIQDCFAFVVNNTSDHIYATGCKGIEITGTGLYTAGGVGAGTGIYTTDTVTGLRFHGGEIAGRVSYDGDRGQFFTFIEDASEFRLNSGTSVALDMPSGTWTNNGAASNRII